MKTTFFSGLALALLLAGTGSAATNHPYYYDMKTSYSHGYASRGGYAAGVTYSSYYGGFDGYGYNANGVAAANYPAGNSATGSELGARVQEALALMGYYHGPIDGRVGSGTSTATAITSYQRDHHMPTTGAVDGNLIGALFGYNLP